MPVEVVSLLSSSEAGSPPRQKAAQSSSPWPKISKRREFEGDNVLSPTLSPRREVNPKAMESNLQLRAQTSTDDVWLISDDEIAGVRDVHQRQNIPVNGTPHKRRKLDHWDVIITSPNGGSVQGTTGTPLRSCGPNRFNSAALSQPEFKLAKSRRDLLDGNPFVSSSPSITEQPSPRVHSHITRLPSSHLVDGALESSPVCLKGPEPSKTSSRLAFVEDIDPFASSSPGPPHRTERSARPTAAWDPISSSAPLPGPDDDDREQSTRPLRRTQSAVVTLDDSDDDCVAQPVSEDDFPDIADLATSKRKFDTIPKSSAVSIAANPGRKPKPARTRGAPAEVKHKSLEKAKEKEEKAAAREAEKERKRLEKEIAKEERAQEKARAAALAEVNKIRTDKKVSTPEMIVDLPITLNESVKLQATTLLRDLDVQSAPWASLVPNVIKWRRKVCSRYNDDLGHWEPIPERIEKENYAMVVVPAAQFVGLVLGKEDASLEYHVERMKDHFPDDTIIYLIEGLALWLRRNRSVRNREFVTAVRSGLEPVEGDDQQPPPSTQRQRKRKAAPPQTYIDEETIEASLLQLQVFHNVLIHHTTIPLETARWIAVFTQHISTVPYRRQRDAANDAAFCMETGQVRTGDGPRDTYVRMLQEIGRVTAPIAYGIAAEFGTVSRLVKGLEDGGPLTLEKVRKSLNKEGEVSDRAVGQAVSRRLHKIFLGRDETSTDI
ncbi:ERCC4 domain-containing protein [Corynascus novoguineensis]|uniref:ERCC4 domain-containing protein n=1 Tax=Corynascus novoguineensis TaxID=1126955 RepID=A0AAN7HT61_9PEZI|nr:ERCC4 domain-containing protein [Corynascus novoguineensis]